MARTRVLYSAQERIGVSALVRRLLVGVLLVVQALILAGLFFASTFEMYFRSRPVARGSDRASSRAAGRARKKGDRGSWME